jgi:predicted nucleic acid-binding protein
VIVVDASAVLELLLGTDRARVAGERLLDAEESIAAPHLIDLEVTQVLRRYCRSNDLTPQRANEALEDLAALPISRYPHDLFVPRIWQLRHSLSAYDAAYIALGEALEAPVLTCDRGLASSTGHQVSVELL